MGAVPFLGAYDKAEVGFELHGFPPCELSTRWRCAAEKALYYKVWITNEKITHRVRRDPFCRRQNIALLFVSRPKSSKYPVPGGCQADSRGRLSLQVRNVFKLLRSVLFMPFFRVKIKRCIWHFSPTGGEMNLAPHILGQIFHDFFEKSIPFLVMEFVPVSCSH